MRVLLHIPFQVLSRANGGKTVFFKTKEYLERAGVQVDLLDNWYTDLARYDLVHSFTMEGTDTWDFVKASNLKLVVSPISWFGVYATRRSRVVRWIKRKVRSKISCPLHPYWWEDCFGLPDLLFPQSQEQARQLRSAFGVPVERILVVPHGVDERFSRPDPTLFTDAYGVRDFVLCVGRMDPIKNQLSLIRALRGTGIPLVLIGRPDTPRFEWYYDQCAREADGSVRFIRDMDHDSPLLPSSYAAARVLALPGFQEIPGLAALEAGLAGCNVAVTGIGVAQEYLGDRVQYLNPRSVSSIRETVLDYYYHGVRPNTALQEHIRQNYMWDAVVKGNVEGYHRVLNAQ